MMEEYGGYMEFEYFHGKEYHEGAYRFNTARHALRYVLKEKGIQEIFLPEYLCPVIAEACEQEGVRIFYYPVRGNFEPIYEEIPIDAWFYFINYYGQFDNYEIKFLQAHHPNIIVDNVQAFFQKPLEGVDTLYTCRKFFGVPDGAYLYTDIPSEKYNDLSRDTSINRIEYLVGRMEEDASSYYGDFRNASKVFCDEPIRRMSKFTENMMRGIDYRSVLKKRMENFRFLHERLGEYNKLSINIVDGGYMYPLYMSNGADLRYKLVRQKIYVPVLWPGLMEEVGELAQNILPLPIDQRYGLEDMKLIVEAVKKCIA